MLGDESVDALMAAGSVLPFYADPNDRAIVTARAERDRMMGPHEIEWKRRDNQRIRVHLGRRRGRLRRSSRTTERQRLEDQARRQARSRPVAGAAHDFNNALTIIPGFADMIAMIARLMGHDVVEILAPPSTRPGSPPVAAFSRQQPLT
jgi:signal transduction histidine kinase